MIHVNYNTIDNTLFAIKKRLFASYSVDNATRIIEPLCWYITTGRAPTDFLCKLVNANSRQLTTISNRLAKHGSYDDAIASVRQYLGC